MQAIHTDDFFKIIPLFIYQKIWNGSETKLYMLLKYQYLVLYICKLFLRKQLIYSNFCFLWGEGLRKIFYGITGTRETLDFAKLFDSYAKMKKNNKSLVRLGTNISITKRKYSRKFDSYSFKYNFTLILKTENAERLHQSLLINYRYAWSRMRFTIKRYHYRFKTDSIVKVISFAKIIL